MQALCRLKMFWMFRKMWKLKSFFFENLKLWMFINYWSPEYFLERRNILRWKLKKFDLLWILVRTDFCFWSRLHRKENLIDWIKWFHKDKMRDGRWSGGRAQKENCDYVSVYFKLSERSSMKGWCKRFVLFWSRKLSSRTEVFIIIITILVKFCSTLVQSGKHFSAVLSSSATK